MSTATSVSSTSSSDARPTTAPGPILSLPMSLQDTSRLLVTMRLEEFPIETLSLLPLATRRKLLNGLSCSDVLHLEGTPVTDGVDMNFNEMRGEFLQGLLHCSSECLQNMLSINFKQDQDELEPYWYDKEVPNEYIASVYPNCRDWQGCILPPRFLQYLSFDHGELELVSSSFGASLVEYCKAQQGNSVDLDCIVFSKSVFWRDYLIQSYERNPAYNISVDMAYSNTPLQTALSGIERLRLSCCNHDPDNRQTVEAVSYVVFRSVVTSKQPCLKHLEINSYTMWILSGVSKFLFESKYELCNDPYPLESLSLSVVECSNATYEFLSIQLSHLKRLCVEFRPEFSEAKTKSELQQDKVCNAIVSFLEQPQVQSLRAAMFPLPVTCKLVETFLTTPTTMEQELVVICGDCSEDIHDFLPPMITHLIPESSAHFKSLELRCSSSNFRAWFYNLSEVKLKSLSLCEFDALFPDFNSPCSVFQVQNIALSYPTSKSPIYLDKFLLFNHALKKLEIEFPDESFYPIFTLCLSQLCQQVRRGFEELHITERSFVNVSDVKEFFAVIRDISHQCGTTLVLNVPCVRSHKYFSEEQACSILPELSREFQTMKIKKVVCKRTRAAIPKHFESFIKKNTSTLNLIAEHVEFSR